MLLSLLLLQLVHVDVKVAKVHHNGVVTALMLLLVLLLLGLLLVPLLLLWLPIPLPPAFAVLSSLNRRRDQPIERA